MVAAKLLEKLFAGFPAPVVFGRLSYGSGSDDKQLVNHVSHGDSINNLFLKY